METNNITQASRLVYWSAEDNCFIGSLPDICGNCCHADNEEDVHRQLDVIEQEWAEIETKQANCAFDKLTANSSPQEIATVAALYTRVITWSEEDSHFIGALPEIDGVCTYADTVEKCAANLQECAEIALKDYLQRGIPLNPPKNK